jgi:hypothetical protein
MAHEITVYDHPESFFAEIDDVFSLQSFRHVEVNAQDDDVLRDVVDNALESLSYDRSSLPTSLAVWLSFPDQNSDPSTQRRWSPDSPYWGVAEDGSLLVEGWNLSTMTVGDLLRASASGYLGSRAWDQIVVLHPEGLGGPGDMVSPFLDFLSDVGLELTVAAAATQVERSARVAQRFAKDRRARQVVDSWHEQGIEGPWILTKWIDVKTSWHAAEVAKRLRLSGEEAESLLTAMGYEYSDHLKEWTVGTTRKSIGRRRRWDECAQAEWQRSRHRP